MEKKILSKVEIDELLAFGWDTPDMVDRMFKAYSALYYHICAGGKLDQKQEDSFNWIEEKLAKWRD